MQGFQDTVSVVSTIGQAVVSVNEVQKLLGDGRLVLLARRQAKLDGLSVQTDDRMKLRGETTSGSPEAVGSGTTTAARRVLVCPNNRGVENRPYLLLNGGAAEQVIPPTAKGPIAESIVDGLPRAKIGIQVAPGNTGSCQPHNRIDEIAIRTF
jgi:hypothetical protein